MPVYMIVETKEVMDEEMYGQYIKQVPQTVAKFGGKYLARGENVSLILGEWRPERLIIIEFESMHKFASWLSSPEYKAVAPLRERSAKVNAIIVKGV